MVTVQQPEENLSTGELISRLTRETTALVKAEVARVKLQASSIVAPAISVGIFAMLGAATFVLGLVAFGVALFSGIHSLTGSFVIAGLIVGAVLWVLAAIAGAICAAMVRAIPLKLKQG